MDIGLFNMDFGESVLLKDGSNGLLVDCGSAGPRKAECFGRVYNEVKEIGNLRALLSHFHDDHMNGFLSLMECGVTFKLFFLPYVFSTKPDERPNAVDYALMERAFRYYILGYKNNGDDSLSSMLALLKSFLSGGRQQSICLLEKGMQFPVPGSGAAAETFWPVPKDKANLLGKFTDTFLSNDLFKKLLIDGNIWNNIQRQFTDIGTEISKAYLALDDSRRGGLIPDAPESWFQRIEARIDDACRELGYFWESLGEEYQKAMSRTADKHSWGAYVRGALKDYLDLLKKYQNKHSVVFHAVNREKPILMTGDIPASIMESEIISSLGGQQVLRH